MLFCEIEESLSLKILLWCCIKVDINLYYVLQLIQQSLLLVNIAKHVRKIQYRK